MNGEDPEGINPPDPSKALIEKTRLAYKVDSLLPLLGKKVLVYLAFPQGKTVKGTLTLLDRFNITIETTQGIRYVIRKGAISYVKEV